MTPRAAEIWADDVAAAADRDPALAAIVAAYGVPEKWLRPPGFPTLVLLILEQQVSLASGAAAYRRLREAIGTMAPERVLAGTAEQLDGVGR